MTDLTYQAKSLADIAHHFESMATIAQQRADRSTTQTEKRSLIRESTIWKAAANILRHTQIVTTITTTTEDNLP